MLKMNDVLTSMWWDDITIDQAQEQLRKYSKYELKAIRMVEK